MPSARATRALLSGSTSAIPISVLRSPLAAALALTVSALLALPAASGAAPTLAPPAVVAGPSSAIVSLGGLSVARDGTGGLVFLAQVGGVPHVFVSRLSGGAFQAPQELDASLPSGSSQPVIAAGNGGVLLVAFISGGALYVADSSSSQAAFAAPKELNGAASNPSIAMSNFGKAYVAFTAAGSGGDDVRAAYYYSGSWGVEPTPLDANPADDAGVGTGRPVVAVSGDGVAIVAWGEAGHVYTRRVWGTSASVAYEQADPSSVSGWSEVSADEPSIGTGGDSSYADVGFRETLANGSQRQTRVLMSRLVAGSYQPPLAADGLTTPGSDGANDPQVLEGEYGTGFLLSAHNASNQLYAMNLGSNGAASNIVRIDSAPNAGPPDAVAGTAGLYSSVIAWQEQSVLGTSEIHLRYGDNGGALGPEQVASSDSMGPTQATKGLGAAGDVSGDVAVAWVQGTGAGTEIVSAQMFQAPGGFAPAVKLTYSNSTQPTLTWSAARELWGPVAYHVTVDGAVAGVTTSASLRLPTAIGQGRHTWQVTAVNRAGLSRVSKSGTVFVDTVAPTAAFSVSGSRFVGAPIRVDARDSDGSGSGVASAVISWGDGVTGPVSRTKFHVYSKPGTYTITLTVTDRAGNKTVVTHIVQIHLQGHPGGTK